MTLTLSNYIVLNHYQTANFRRVQTETNCRRHFKVPYRVENIVRKGKIACYKQLLLFSQCFPQLYILGASKSGIV